MRLKSPEETARVLVDRLPAQVGDTLWTAWNVISWISLPVVFLSQAGELQKVANWYAQIYGALAALHPFLDGVAALVTPLMTSWKDLTAPFRFSLQEMFPAAPTWAFDTGAMLGLAAPVVVRYTLLRAQAAMFERRAGLRSGRRLRDAVESADGAGVDRYASDQRTAMRRRRALAAMVGTVVASSVLSAVGLALVAWNNAP